MSTIYCHHPSSVQSLIERKKQQWAREREELAGLSENAPWGSRDSLQLYDRPYIKTRYVTKYQKENEYLRRDSSYSTASASSATSGTPRRQPASFGGYSHPHAHSLPPLHKNQHFTYTPDEKSDKEMGGETSGYGSDNPQHSPRHIPPAGGGGHTNVWTAPAPPSATLAQQPHQLVVGAHNHANASNNNGYESSSSGGREDRLKWGRYWDGAKEAIPPAGDPTPGWVKRGLERATELVVNNSSPAESPEQTYGDRPCTSSSTNTNKCYIRGQNVPVEPAELAERERRRQIALAHQEAIRQQLEEREKRRQEERARRLREEYEEERRIAHEQQIERQRHEEQERMRFEKEERDRKRKEALREAIEIAEKEAKEEKLKQRLMRQNQLSCLVQQEKTIDKDIKTKKNEKLQEEDHKEFVSHSEKIDSNKEEMHTNSKRISKDEEKSILNDQPLVSTVSTVSTVQEMKTLSSSDSEASMPSSAMHSLQSLPVMATTQENLAVVLQNPLAESFQNVQFVLIPSLSSLPMSITTAVQTNSMPNASTSRTENRILTPTQYRNKKQTCDSSTQTDFVDYRKELCERLGSIEIYEGIRSRKGRRSRSEMRDMEPQERPKWGVNRPPTRYLKQSEKDPLYQRRKLRQKMRLSKTYDDKRYSSDDSTGSPRSYRKKRGVWRKDDSLYGENVRVYQTEIIPLESDKDRIYFRAKPHYPCCCRCIGCGPGPEANRVDILKVETPRELREKLPVCNNNAATTCAAGENGVLDKLTSIHNDIMSRDHWEERNQILCSPSRNS